jgi:predicted MFS family arabinose efflux permease
MAGLVALMGINVLSLRQAVVPNQLPGRVSSSLIVLVGLAMPLGALIGGIAIERAQNVTLVFAAIGGIIFATGVVFPFTSLRHAERYMAE